MGPQAHSRRGAGARRMIRRFLFRQEGGHGGRPSPRQLNRRPLTVPAERAAGKAPSGPAADMGGSARPANWRPGDAALGRGPPRHEKRAPEGPRLNDMEKKEGGRRGGDAPAAPPRPSPRHTGRAPSTGQRRPALPRADPAVPSALGGLASGFGMGPGVPRPPWPLTGGRRSSSDDESASHA